MAKKKVSVFSIALSLVVAGIVAAGFLVSRGYISRSFEVAQQSQAKIALIHAYDAERKFFAKNGRYSDDLVDLELCDLKDAKLFCGLPRQGAYYKIGFARGDSGRHSVDHVLAKFPEQLNQFQFASQTPTNDAKALALVCGDCLVSQNRFKIVALGSIGQGKFDAWTIDQDRKMEHLKLSAEGKMQ